MNYGDLLWTVYGLPKPESEYRFALPRQWRFDYCWPDHKVAVEIEGAIFTQGRHTRGTGYKKDMEKYNQAAKNGWRVFRFQPTELRKGIAQAFMKEILS
jgi:very-short-patch-repair endonuclease